MLRKHMPIEKTQARKKILTILQHVEKKKTLISAKYEQVKHGETETHYKFDSTEKFPPYNQIQKHDTISAPVHWSAQIFRTQPEIETQYNFREHLFVSSCSASISQDNHNQCCKCCICAHCL